MEQECDEAAFIGYLECDSRRAVQTRGTPSRDRVSQRPALPPRGRVAADPLPVHECRFRRLVLQSESARPVQDGRTESVARLSRQRRRAGGLMPIVSYDQKPIVSPFKGIV